MRKQCPRRSRHLRQKRQKQQLNRSAPPATSHCNRPSETAASMLLPRAVRLQARTTPAASEPAKLISDKVLEVWSANPQALFHIGFQLSNKPQLCRTNLLPRRKKRQRLWLWYVLRRRQLLSQKGFHLQVSEGLTLSAMFTTGAGDTGSRGARSS